jgi:serine/threonine-protein kinase HipA
MPKSLDVYLQSDLVGHLSQGTGGQMHFQYIESWLDGSGAVPLSQSLPLRKERFSQKECRGYFGGILPEASNREVVARNLGISARNDFAMLKEIGGECAGAVTFVPTGDRLSENPNSHRTLSSSELAAVLRELRKRPLLAGQEGIRQSLAGAQDKVAVCLSGDEISLPLDEAPSTHVLKPAVERFEGVVQNESLCMRLAAAIGLPTAKVEARSVEGMDYLLVERYDRFYRKDSIHEPVLQRLHQEDFCQALGIFSEMKYQNEGGPSLKQCFALLRKVSSAPAVDLARLLDAVIFNYLVGNNDAHGKNFSLLYCGLGTDDPHVGLAPLYDILSTVYYPELSRTMAMKLGGEYSSAKVRPHNFEQLAEDAGLEKSLVIGRVAEMVEEIRTVLPQIPSDEISSSIAARILERCERIQKRFQQ